MSFIRRENGLKTNFVFDGVCGLRVVEYGLQNVVFSLLTSSLSRFTHELLLFVADPSCGAEVGIVARTFTLK